MPTKRKDGCAQLNVELPARLKRDLQMDCISRGISMTEVINVLTEVYLETTDHTAWRKAVRKRMGLS